MAELGSLAELGSPEWSQLSQTSPDDVHLAEMASALVPEGAVGSKVKRGEGKDQGSVEAYIWKFKLTLHYCRVKLAQPPCSFDDRTWLVQKQLAPGSASSPSAKQSFHAKRN